MKVHKRFQPKNVNSFQRPVFSILFCNQYCAERPKITLKGPIHFGFRTGYVTWNGFFTMIVSLTAKGYTGALRFIVGLVMRLDCIESTWTTIDSRLFWCLLSLSFGKSICSERSSAIISRVGGMPNINSLEVYLSLDFLAQIAFKIEENSSSHSNVVLKDVHLIAFLLFEPSAWHAD